MTTFSTASCKRLKDLICKATSQVVLVAPGVSKEVAEALGEVAKKEVSVRVVLDADEDVCRIGYGGVEGFEGLLNLSHLINIQKHPGIRLGMLMTDDVLVIWSPIPRSVDGDRSDGEFNSIEIEDRNIRDRTEQYQVTLSHQIHESLKDVGNDDVDKKELEQIVDVLKENPPAPFDLSRKIRVLSTKFQFVEATLKGAQ